MSSSVINFSDGSSYEQYMGVWSRLVGDEFLDWLAPAPGLRWVDIGCGNGAFTDVLMQRCAPTSIHAIDPSEAQLSFARTRPGAQGAVFESGNAMTLSYPDQSFDAAVMALVLFFVPDTTKGIAEMKRVVRPGGLIAAYVWDVLGGGLPVEPVDAGMREMGYPPAMPSSVNVSHMPNLIDAWTTAGLTAIKSRTITVRRDFADFDAFWNAAATSDRTQITLRAMGPGKVEVLRQTLRETLPAAPDGRLTMTARANAISGEVPAN